VARSELDSSLFAVARVSTFAEEDVEVEEDESIEAMLLLCCCCCLIAPSIAAAS
jgi:hypothetical protein